MVIMDCLVVGAGAIGMMTAWELSQAGMSVAIIDKSQIGQESSWAGGGILSPLYPWRYPPAVQQLAIWSQKMYPDLAASWYEASGIDPQWQQNGMLILDTDELSDASAWARLYGYQLEHIDAASVAELAPGVNHQFDAMWMPKIGQIRNPRLVKALRGSLQSRGVLFHENTQVTDFIIEKDKVKGVMTDSGPLYADKIVIAGGAWTAGLLNLLGETLPIEPVKGQMLLFAAQPGLLTRIVLSHDRYLIPRRDGRILVGSTLEKSGFDKSTSEAAQADLFYAAVEILPNLGTVPIEKHWAGLRPGSPQGIPFIYKSTTYTNIYVNAGHFRNGLVLGPASAHLMSNIILDRPPIADIESYQPVAAGEMLAI